MTDLLLRPLMRGSELGTARFERPFPIRRDEALDLLDERRKRLLGIGSDGKIRFLVAAQIAW